MKSNRRSTCPYFRSSIDDLYAVWAETLPEEANPGEVRALIHTAFVTGIAQVLEIVTHLTTHAQAEEDVDQWHARMLREARAFVGSVKHLGVSVAEEGLGSVLAEAARLMVEEGIKTSVGYNPNLDPKFVLGREEVSPTLLPADLTKDEALKKFLGGWKPGEGGGLA